MENLNFRENKVQVIDLPTLAKTYKENDVYGNPLKGIYHYQLINSIVEAAKSEGLTTDVWDVFAAQNANKNAPGVSILPQVEAVQGENATEAHILRRVYANIRLTDNDTDELTTNLAVAFHQDGIEVAIGEAVKVCHNQTILSAEHRAATFGKDGHTPEELLQIVGNWIKDSRRIAVQNRHRISAMKKVEISANTAYQIIGMLTAVRVAHDTSNKNIRNTDTYPLNQAQISQFTENLLIRSQENNEHLTLWDVYDCATELYKGDQMEIPNILPQGAAMAKFLEQFYTVTDVEEIQEN